MLRASAGLKLRKDKCVFLAASVEYFGHQIDTQGLHPIAWEGGGIAEGPAALKYGRVEVVPGPVDLLL